MTSGAPQAPTLRCCVPGAQPGTRLSRTQVRRESYSRAHGHRIIWPRAPCVHAAPDTEVGVRFDRTGVELPSGSALDLPARISLVVPPDPADQGPADDQYVRDAERARAWASARGVRLVAVQRDEGRDAAVVEFDVDGFSRFAMQANGEGGSDVRTGQQGTAETGGQGPWYGDRGHAADGTDDGVGVGAGSTDQANENFGTGRLAGNPREVRPPVGAGQGTTSSGAGAKVEPVGLGKVEAIPVQKRIVVPMFDEDEEDLEGEARGEHIGTCSRHGKEEGVAQHDGTEDMEDGPYAEDDQIRAHASSGVRHGGSRTGSKWNRAPDSLCTTAFPRIDSDYGSLRTVANALFSEESHDELGSGRLHSVSTVDGMRAAISQQAHRHPRRDALVHARDPFLWRRGMSLPKTTAGRRAEDRFRTLDDGLDVDEVSSARFSPLGSKLDVDDELRATGQDNSDRAWQLDSSQGMHVWRSSLRTTYRESLTSRVAANHPDRSLAMAYSFRPCFAPRSQIMLPCWDNGATTAGIRHAAYVCQRLRIGQKLNSLERIPVEGFVRCLRIHAVAWAVSRQSPLREDTPYAPQVPTLATAFESGRASGSGIADSVMENILQELTASDETGLDINSGHAGVVFGLLSALYRQPKNEGDNLLSRVVSWSSQAACTSHDPPVPSSQGLPRVLGLLTIGDIDGAVDAASLAGFYRLSMMISRVLESSKEDLRADAMSHLDSHGLLDGAGNPAPSEDHELMSVEEQLIVCLLAGSVSVVARYMRLSWYRLFLMELLYGLGSTEQTYSERISAAVAALECTPDIPAIPPHGSARGRDAAYHMLRLYADPTASYPLTAGVFSPSSFGAVEDPLDARFPWLLHQLLSALVPQVVLPGAVRLSDAYAAQLEAAGLPLWSFYVLCSGEPPPQVVHDTLVRCWPEMRKAKIELADGLIGYDVPVQTEWDEYTVDLVDSDVDTAMVKPEEAVDASGFEVLSSVKFLVHVLRIPSAWICEAEAVRCRYNSDELRECRAWLKSNTQQGRAYAHELIADILFPRALSMYDSDALDQIAGMLQDIGQEKRLVNWSTRGGLILDYLEYFAFDVRQRKWAGGRMRGDGQSAVNETGASELMGRCRSMVPRVNAYLSRSSNVVQRHAAVTIANSVANGQRVAVLRDPSCMEDAVADLERLPVTPSCARRIAADYRDQAESESREGDQVRTVAFPGYAQFLDNVNAIQTL